MICAKDNSIALQNNARGYTFTHYHYFMTLSTWISKTGIGYTQIAPTNLVEWGG